MSHRTRGSIERAPQAAHEEPAATREVPADELAHIGQALIAAHRSLALIGGLLHAAGAGHQVDGLQLYFTLQMIEGQVHSALDLVSPYAGLLETG